MILLQKEFKQLLKYG